MLNNLVKGSVCVAGILFGVCVLSFDILLRKDLKKKGIYTCEKASKCLQEEANKIARES